MKLFPQVVRASAVTLFLVSAASQAAIIPVNISVAGTIAGAAAGTSNGTYTGTYNDATGQILASGSINPLTAYTNAIIGTNIDVTDLTGTSTVTSCSSAPGVFIDLCAGNAGYGVPPTNIGDVSSMPITVNTVDSSGNGSFTTVSVSANATVTSVYTVAAVTEVPVPAAAWLFGSAILGLVGVARRRKAVAA